MSETKATIQEEINLIVKVARSERFHFIVVAYDHLSLIGQVKEALKSKYPQRKVTEFKVGSNSNPDLIQQLIAVSSGLVFIDDFELLLKDDGLALGFNQKRDRIAQMPIALVCFVPYDRKLLQECPRKIPDMWSIRSLLAELKGYAPTKGLVFAGDFRGTPYRNYSLQEKEEEIAALQKRINAIERNADTEGLYAQLCQNLGGLFYSLGSYTEALESNKVALNIYHEIQDKKGEGEVYNDLGEIDIELADYDTALRYLEQSLAIRQQIGDRSGEGTTLNNISQIHKFRGDYDTALRYLEQSLAIRQQIGDRSGEGTTLNNIATTAYVKGDYDTALRYLEQSLAIQQQIGDRSGEGTTLNNISQIHKVRGDYDTAMRYLEQSLAIQQQIGDRSGEGTTLNNISQIHKVRGDYESALRYLEQSLAIQQQIGDRSGLCSTLHNLATIYLDQKEDVEKYLEYEVLAYQTAQEIGDVNAVFQVGWYLGGTLCKLGTVEQGLRILENVYQIGLQSGYPNVEKVGALIQQYRQE